MTERWAKTSSQPPAGGTVAQVMHPALTTAELGDHVAAAAYLMKHGGTAALVVVDEQTGRPVGIITDSDVAHVVADGKDVNEVRIAEVMTRNPAVIPANTTIREAARLMTSQHIRQLPVVDASGLTGIVDIDAVCRALLGPDDQ